MKFVSILILLIATQIVENVKRRPISRIHNVATTTERLHDRLYRKPSKIQIGDSQAEFVGFLFLITFIIDRYGSLVWPPALLLSGIIYIFIILIRYCIKNVPIKQPSSTTITTTTTPTTTPSPTTTTKQIVTITDAVWAFYDSDEK